MSISPIALMFFGSPPLPATLQAVPTAPVSEPSTQGFEIDLPASLDDRYLGDIAVLVDGDRVSFDGVRLVELLRSDLTPPALELLQQQIVDGRLTPATATTQDVLVEYNSSLQEIRVTTAVSARQRRIIDFRTSPSENKTATIAPSNLSAFLTTSAAYQYIWENRTAGVNSGLGRQPISGTIDFGGRIGGDKGIAFVSRQNYQEGRGAFIQRTETQLIYDRPKDLLRITAGDLRYRGSSFQSLPRLAGVTVERFFGLEPSRSFRPIGQTAFELERSSTVDVRINGVVFQQLLLQPGRYDLRDIPLVQGANDVELIVRDDTGREQIISDRNFFDFNLLQQGMSDFSFSGGIRSRLSANGVRYSDAYAFSGFYRRGLSNTLTAGVDAQFDQQGVTGGASMVWAAPIGVFRLEAAGSKRSGIGAGFALDAGYSVTGKFNKNWSWAGQLNGQLESRRFSTLADTVLPAIGELRPNAYSLNANLQVSNARWNVTASAQYDKGRGASPTRKSGLFGATYSVNSRLTVGAFARYTDNGFRQDKGGFFQITWRPARNQSARASYDTATQEAQLGYRYSPSNTVGSTQGDINIRRDARQDSLNISGSLFHVGNRFEASLQHDVFTTANFSADRVQTTRASVSNSIVLVGGKLALARPVREGFAVISPHKSLKGKTILADPTESGARAQSDSLGGAVVPDLSSYSRSSLYIDVVDLPPGYDLGSGQFSLKPPLYAGYNLTAGSGASVTILGQVVRGQKNEPVALTAGKMEALDGSKGEPISVFTNRNGRLAGTGLRPGKYKLTLFTTPAFTTEVTIPDNGENLINIGELRIAEE
jgi:outer membrane usher protein